MKNLVEGVNMIEKIKIHNFRCFEDFSIEDLAPITIIGGKNNSGKTALLESLVVPMTTHFPSVFLDIMSSRIIGAVSITSRQMWNSLFYNMDDSEEFSLKIFPDFGKKFTFTAKKNYGGKIKRSDSKHKNFTTPTYKNFDSLKVTAKFEQDLFKGEYVLPNSTEIELKHSEKEKPIQLPYGSLTFCRNITIGGSLAELVSQIGLDKEKKLLLISTMKNFDEEIEDINTVLDNGSPYVYVTLKSGKHFPINYMGDGINKAVEILIDILNLPNGILLIDEVENGFHYSLYKKLLKIFFETALSVQCQIVMTSHSLEFIENVLEVMREMKKLDSLSYQRLGFSKGKRKAFNFSGNSLLDAFETDMEVR